MKYNQKGSVTLITLAVFVVLVIATVGYMAATKKSTVSSEPTIVELPKVNPQTNTPTNPPAFSNDPPPRSLPEYQYTETSVPREFTESIGGVMPYLVEVEWQKEPTLVHTADCKIQGDCNLTSNYIVGRITNGKLAGNALYLWNREYEIGSEYTHYIVWGNNRFLLTDKGFKIKGISDLPEQITMPGSGYKMKKWYSIRTIQKDARIVKKLFTIPSLGDLYLSESGCIVLQLPDGTVIAYDFVLPFINAENGELNLTFNDKTKGSEQYNYTTGGCVFQCRQLSIVDEEKLNLVARLAPIGKSSNGETFYEYKDSNDHTLTELYNSPNTVAYMNTEAGKYEHLSKNKYTYAEYLAFHPLLYWQDPIGRWVEFRNKRFEYAAEKCKPVIYLYPKEKSALNVQVTPNGGFIKTIPQYPEGGWNVVAYPNGKIVDPQTGLEYEYLYWSGIGLGYPVNPEEGWVVKREDISAFLDAKLKILGLNEKEAADFKEYWVAKLSEMPYYQMSFVSKPELDQMSPLKVGPAKPDSVIRVMLTAKGLSESKDMKPQDLGTTPIRQGFAVVEWGGALLR